MLTIYILEVRLCFAHLFPISCNIARLLISPTARLKLFPLSLTNLTNFSTDNPSTAFSTFPTSTNCDTRRKSCAKKQRVWSLHQFIHFLKVHNLIEKNIAAEIPYPKIIKKVPDYLTIDEFNKLLHYAVSKANNLTSLRDLVIFMILGLLGLRLKALQTLNIQDVNLATATLLVKEKGCLKRQFCMPQVLCVVLTNYLKLLNLTDGPLLLSKRGKRISARTLELFFQQAMAHLKIDKHLHAHLFRHTAATHLNKVAGPVITQFVLGHARSQSTQVYTHLNPDQYAVYMKKHPYHLI